MPADVFADHPKATLLVCNTSGVQASRHVEAGLLRPQCLGQSRQYIATKARTRQWGEPIEQVVNRSATANATRLLNIPLDARHYCVHWALCPLAPVSAACAGRMMRFGSPRLNVPHADHFVIVFDRVEHRAARAECQRSAEPAHWNDARHRALVGATAVPLAGLLHTRRLGCSERRVAAGYTRDD